MAQFKITISDDDFTATVWEVGPRAQLEEIVEALNGAGVTSGLQSSRIIAAIEEAKTTGKPVVELIAAEGEPPKATVPPKLEYVHVAKIPSLKAVVTALACEQPQDMKSIKEAGAVVPISADAVIARQVVGEVKPGMTVKGKELLSLGTDNLPPHFAPGNGVTLSQQGEYRAEHAGYLGMVDGRMSVVSPVWVAPDGDLAAFLCLPTQEGVAPMTSEDVDNALEFSGVKSGIDLGRVNSLVERMASGDAKRALLPVARGEAPKEPVDGQADFHFNYHGAAGEEQKDGSIDLRERQGIPTVAEDEVLVEATPPVPGEAGVNVRGEPIEPRKPSSVELIAGESVRLETEGETTKLVSSINGGASVKTAETSTEAGPVTAYTVAVMEIAQISGDVDYETGNVNFKGNVEVKGTVKSGFEVISSGNIVVMESVENGAILEAEGDITVKQGIVGEKTVVKAGATVHAKFIQEAHIVAGGDVEAESYIRVAKIEAKGSVLVPGKGSSGGIMGGETWAVKSVVANNIGAEGTTTTLVALGVQPDTFEVYEKAQKEARDCKATGEALRKALGVSSWATEELKSAIAQNPRRKDEILRYVKKAREAAKAEGEANATMAQLDTEVAEHSKAAHADVKNVAHRKVRIRIGYEEMVMTADLKGSRFRLGTKDGEQFVDCVSLSDVNTSPDKKED